MTAAQRRYVVVETLISIAINVAISAGFVLLVFGGRGRVALWGSGGLAVDFVPQSFMIALMSVIVPTALTRKRVSAGAIAGMPGGPARLPRNLFLRALLVALISAIAFAAGVVALLAALLAGPIPFRSVLMLKLAYGALVALIVTPFAVRTALGDQSETGL